MNVLLNIDVPDVQAAAAFYQAALGLELKRILDADVAELSGAGVKVFLLQKPAGSAAVADSGQAPRTYERHWTPIHIDFVVEDLEQAARRALAAGAHQEGSCVQWRGSRCISFADPFGHGFCLICFSADEYA